MPQHAAQPERLDDKLRQAQRLEAVGRLAGGIAHDFNNMLLVINGYSDLVAARIADEEIRADVIEIRRAGERAATLTRQLLAFCRHEERLPHPVNLSDVVRDVETMVRALVGDQVLLTTSLHLSLDLVSADAAQLEQVVVNLAVNARDAMPGGGALQIATANVRCRDGGYVRLRVRDSGVGMDAETRRRIFAPFFTTKPRGEGTGLGLGIVLEIVDECGGYVEVTSAPDAGSTFDVYLPAIVAPDLTP